MVETLNDASIGRAEPTARALAQSPIRGRDAGPGLWVTDTESASVGLRAGPMPEHFDAARADQILAADGYGSVRAYPGPTAPAGLLYIGYELSPVIGVEFGFGHRDARTATLNATVGSSGDTASLLRDATHALNGYGNIYSLSVSTRWEPVDRFTISPRLGAYLWQTKVAAEANAASADATRGGGGLTVGAGAGYRIWRSLNIGVGVDYYRGTQNNIATLYGGFLEWRFGQR